MSDIIDKASFDQFTDFKTVDEMVNSKSKIYLKFFEKFQR